MAEPIDTGWPAGFDPFVHWAGRFGLRRAIKRLLSPVRSVEGGA